MYNQHTWKNARQKWVDSTFGFGWNNYCVENPTQAELLGKTGKAPYVNLYYLSFDKAWAAGFIEKSCFALYTQMAILKYEIPAFIFWWPDGFPATANSKTQHDQLILEIAGLTEPRPDELLSFLLSGGLFSSELNKGGCVAKAPPLSSAGCESHLAMIFCRYLHFLRDSSSNYHPVLAHLVGAVLNFSRWQRRDLKARLYHIRLVLISFNSQLEYEAGYKVSSFPDWLP